MNMINMTELKGLSIKNILTLNPDQVQEYWQKLYMDDLLDDRLCDLENPTWSDVLDMVAKIGKDIYHLLENGRIVAEFTLENQTGAAAQIHFSMHPDNTLRQSLNYAEYAIQYIFANSSIETLYGLTPYTNRTACLFALKAGFKKIGILPRGIKHNGAVVDAMISMRTQ